MRFETKAIHAANQTMRKTPDVVPPIHKTNVFEHPKGGQNEDSLNYTRAGNPNRIRLEYVIAQLEGGSDCVAFSSGVAAATGLFFALQPGDHILMPNDVYSGNRMLANEVLIPWGLDVEFVPMSDVDALSAHITGNTRLIWIETPSNPLLNITDITAVSELAHAHNAFVCVDNTWPSPVNQLPLELGADFVMHSTTKYFGGHSDILGGAVISKNESDTLKEVRKRQVSMGAVPSPEDCWMLCRSTQTLPYRMRAHNENAAEVARFLNDHPKVIKVFYPGLKSHPGHEVAKKQMQGFGGMISFQVKGNGEETLTITESSELILRATSLGGVESTWEQRVRSEGPDSTTPENLIRMSVGLEHPDDLLEDLERALG